MPFNMGDVLEEIEKVLPPDAEALVCGDERRTWSDLARRSNNLGRAMLEAGAEPGDKVGFYLRNGNEYMETLAACFKARLTHVNVNYRYLEDELWYILDNSDAAVVVYSAEFKDRLQTIRERLPKVRLWLQAGADPVADFAQSYERLAEAGDGSPLGLQRQPDDLLFLYTGGTTGYPKGVMWEHNVLMASGSATLKQEAADTLQEYGERVRQAHPAQRQLPACPMMHGTGLLTAMNTLTLGGCVVSIPSLRFDAEELWDVTAKERVKAMAIVGDAFAKPMLAALEAHPERWDLSHLTHILSSGVMWSPEVKAGLLAQLPNVLLMDTFGSSEGLGFGGSVSSAEGTKGQSAQFVVGDFAKVFDEDHNEIEPGSDRVGFIAVRGFLPRGYYKDPDKTARTFPEINGVRYSMPGDWCRVQADGSIVLLGRGSACINSAGEKIYAEEVEEALKEHPAVGDALVFGVPDDRWGQAVTAVVLAPPASFDESDLQQFARGQLAPYKVPKRIFATEDMGRADNGKANYDFVKEYALQRMRAEG